MDTFRLGDTTINRLGFGAMRITGDGIWGPPADRDQCIAVLRRAVALGVNFVDTADSYGPHVSEELIAAALHPYPDGLVVATKAGYERPGPGKWEPNLDPRHLKDGCEGSLRRLRVDTIDLWQIHNTGGDYEAALEAAIELRDEGKVRMVGVSNVDAAHLEQARAALGEVVSVQNRYSLGDRRSDDVLDATTSHRIAFIPWYPLGAGSVDHGAVEEVAAKHDATAFQIAIAWLLHRAPNVVPIPGTKSLEHLEENVAAAEIELDGDDLAKLSGTS